VYVLENGGEFTMTDDLTTKHLTFSEPLEVKTTNPVVINGNGKTITYTGADRAFTVENTAAVKTANVTLNNLTFVNTVSYCQRGINFNVAGKLTLNNVTVGETGPFATYAINLPGSSDGAEVVINNSYFRGNIALNVWGENMTINATGSEFVSYDNVEEDYAAIMLNNDGSTIANGTTIYIDGGSVIAYNEKGELSNAVLNSTMTGVVTISDTTVVEGAVSTHVAVVIYEGQNEFYSCSTLKDAINSGKGSTFVSTIQGFRSQYEKYRGNYIAATKLSNHDEHRVGSDLNRSTDKMKLAGAVLLTASRHKRCKHKENENHRNNLFHLNYPPMNNKILIYTIIPHKYTFVNTKSIYLLFLY
jgi:hypothetical protein